MGQNCINHLFAHFIVELSWKLIVICSGRIKKSTIFKFQEEMNTKNLNLIFKKIKFMPSYNKAVLMEDYVLL